MADLAVLASGNGSNFQALAEKLQETDHRIRLLVCDRKEAKVFERAHLLGIPSYYLSYRGRSKKETEDEIIPLLKEQGVQLIVLAGFMRILSPSFIDAFPRAIINIHPSLLPKYSGKNAIERSFLSDDKDLGMSIHLVDYGMDTGPIIFQKRFVRNGRESIEEIKKYIHTLEYQFYPEVVINLLNSLK